MSWDYVEEMLLAILIKYADYSAHRLDAAKEEAFYTDKYGLKRHRKGAGKVFADVAWDLVSEFPPLINLRGSG